MTKLAASSEKSKVNSTAQQALEDRPKPRMTRFSVSLD
jgi:hypothetical protein